MPVPDSGIPREWVDAAREAVKGNVKTANAGRRLWELSGGVGYCACGRRLSIHTNVGRARRRPQFHYVCSFRRRHGSGACEHARFHKAEDFEGRVREFVYRLLHDPESLRRQTLAQLELDQAGLGRVEEEAAFLLERLTEADRERDGYLRLSAKGRISEEELDRYLTELERRKDDARRELAGLSDRRERLAKLEELTETVEEYLGDLPQIIHGGQTDIGAEHRAERYRWAYGLLGLRVVAHGDGTLELTWRAGSEVLGPEEPRAVELPPPDYSGWALSESSDSQR